MLAQQKSASGGGPGYWSDSAEVLGVYEVEGKGLRMRKNKYSKSNGGNRTNGSNDM